MYRTLCVMALVALCAGLAHSFSWDIVVGTSDQLKFIDTNGTLTHMETLTLRSTIRCLTYDPVHNRLLIADFNHFYSFDIATKRINHLMKYTDITRSLYSFIYDPATSVLFWNWSAKLYEITLKPSTNDKRKHHKYTKELIDLKGEKVRVIAIDSCGGFIYWNHYSLIKRAAYIYTPGTITWSEGVFYTGKYVDAITIDQHSQQIYWIDKEGSITSADLNGENIRTIIKYSSKSSTPYLFNIKHMAVSKDFIYFKYHNVEDQTYSIKKILKNSPDMKPKDLIELKNLKAFAVKYSIEHCEGW